jgi:hypothetical protein
MAGNGDPVGPVSRSGVSLLALPSVPATSRQFTRGCNVTSNRSRLYKFAVEWALDNLSDEASTGGEPSTLTSEHLD